MSAGNDSKINVNPSDEVLAWVQSEIGIASVRSRFEHGHAYSKLWRLEVQGQMVWLKMHGQERKWAGEVHALTKWASELGLAPIVLGFRRDPFAILLSEVPGQDAEQIELELSSQERMWGQAGEWLARLHSRTNDWLGEVNIDGSATGAPSDDPVSFVWSVVERRLSEAVPLNLFDAQERSFIVDSYHEWFPSLEGEIPVAIHRDFTPRNWLVERNGNLSGIIDFEHARWDVKAGDLNRTPDHEFLNNPRLRDAFFEAYGKPNSRLEAQIQALRLVQSVSAIVWGVLVGETEYSVRNRVALHRMMTEQPS